MNKTNDINIFIRIPKKPKTFLFEKSQLLMTEKNIKDFAKDFGFTFKLDYIAAKVSFEKKHDSNSN